MPGLALPAGHLPLAFGNELITHFSEASTCHSWSGVSMPPGSLHDMPIMAMSAEEHSLFDLFTKANCRFSSELCNISVELVAKGRLISFAVKWSITFLK